MRRSISSIRQKKCWSCKYYAGSRELKNGFLGTSFEVDERGQCLKGKTNNRDGLTVYSWYCSRYDRAGDVNAYIQKEETKKEIIRSQKEAENYQRQENEKLRKQIQYKNDQIEQERLRLELSKKRSERERWLNSLSSEEREKFLAEEERQAKFNQIYSKLQIKIIVVEEIQKQANKEKRKPLIGFISSLAITIVSIGLGLIPYLSNLFKALENEALAHEWVTMFGYSTDSEQYLEWMALAEQFRSKANEVLYIPFLILGICIVLTIFVTILLLFQRKKKLKDLGIDFKKSKNEALQLIDSIEKLTNENMKV